MPKLPRTYADRADSPTPILYLWFFDRPWAEICDGVLGMTRRLIGRLAQECGSRLAGDTSPLAGAGSRAAFYLHATATAPLSTRALPLPRHAGRSTRAGH